MQPCTVRSSEWLQNRGSRFGAPTATTFSGNRKPFNLPIAASAVPTFIWKRGMSQVPGMKCPFWLPLTITKNPRVGLMSRAPRAGIISRNRHRQSQPIVASAAVIFSSRSLRKRPVPMNSARMFWLDCTNFRTCLGSSERLLLDALNVPVNARCRKRRHLPFARNVERILTYKTTRFPGPTRGQSGQVGGLSLPPKEILSVAAPIVVQLRLKDLFGQS